MNSALPLSLTLNKKKTAAEPLLYENYLCALCIGPWTKKTQEEDVKDSPLPQGTRVLMPPPMEVYNRSNAIHLRRRFGAPRGD